MLFLNAAVCRTHNEVTSVWGDVRLITVIWWWWWNKANQQMKAASSLRLWESLIHPQHSSMEIVSFYGLSDQKNKLESNPVTDIKNHYNNKCLETAGLSHWRSCLIIYFIKSRGASNFYFDRTEVSSCAVFVLLRCKSSLARSPERKVREWWCILWVWSKLFSLTGKPHGGSTQPTSGGPDILNIRTLASSLC